MFPSGVNDSRPLVHGVVGRDDASVDSDGDSGSAPGVPTTSGLMLVDTGSQVSSLDIDVALSLGLTETEQIVAIEGVGGIQYGIQVKGSLYLPESDVRSLAIILCYPIRRNLNIFAILGMDFLSEFILTIHGPNGAINLARPRQPSAPVRSLP